MRVGNIVNFFVSPYIVDYYGFKWALWIGAGFCGMSVLFTAIYFFVEAFAEKKVWIITGRKKSKTIKAKDICHFRLAYWLLCIVCGLYYTNIFALYSVFEDLLKTLFDYSSFYCGILSSLIYFVSIFVSLITGTLVDRLGRRCIFLMIATAMMILFDYAIIFTKINPIISLVFAGISYSIFASTIWSTVPILLPSHTVSTGNSIMTIIQMGIVGISNILVGVISKNMGYKFCIMYFEFLMAIAFILVFFVKYSDYSTNNDKLDWYTPRKLKKEVEEPEKEKGK